MDKFVHVVITCKAKELLDKLVKKTGQTKYFLVGELIEKAYKEKIENE